MDHPAAMSYRKIITVVTEQTTSTVIARYALALAKACEAELVLYAAQPEEVDGNILDHTNRHLEHLAALADALNIPVTRIVEAGNISQLLPKRAEAEKADLVLYPLLPYKRYGTDRQRHTVHHLLRTIKPDLAVIRAISMAKPHPNHVLVPLGRVISNSRRRQLFITALAKSFHAQVTLFHVKAERISREPAAISTFREQLQEQQVTVLDRSGVGDIGTAIRLESVTRRNDLIVLGASERGLLQRLLRGNPAGDILLQPPCNTILFRGAVP